MTNCLPHCSFTTVETGHVELSANSLSGSLSTRIGEMSSLSKFVTKCRAVQTNLTPAEFLSCLPFLFSI